MHQAILYKKLENNKVRCEVCCHGCVIAPSKRGICNVRENQNGILYALNYGKAIATYIDPIEKKPLYNFMPGTMTYSIATAGCNFKCLHCQNADISQSIILGENLLPQEIVNNAINNNCPSISYTYTEPTIFLEYALDTMKLARKNNLKNIWVSNGYFSDKTFELIKKYLDAINVDLKAFSEKFYQKICCAKLQPVLNNLIAIKKNNIHLEVTTLIIPNENDSEQELKNIANFIAEKLGTDTSWHVTAFHPTYKMLSHAPTPIEKIYQAVKIGKKAGLKFVYAGNI
ncbi:AmmeMemoRadiSam system radical SAM enzyme [Patescibacteria group bacterium]|nr:AmmeMemoRadiSam system radical SAM enzyme [Patescibacteria group bacterium]